MLWELIRIASPSPILLFIPLFSPILLFDVFMENGQLSSNTLLICSSDGSYDTSLFFKTSVSPTFNIIN